jgi:serine/threonine protein kinase
LVTEARWLHQIVDRGGGEVDILCCTVNKTNVWNVVMLGEAGFMVACKAKEVQVEAYGVNVSPMLMCGEVLLLFELIMKPKSIRTNYWLRVSAACLPAENQKLQRVKIWEGTFDVSSCAGLLNACDAVSLYNQNLNRRPVTEKISENMWKCDGRIYKVYDYRNRGVEEDERRDHNHSVKLISGTMIELSKQDMNVISYPEIEGASAPSSVLHIISLIRAVKALHEKDIVHADIRASNVIFCANGEAVLIDFDWSGKPNERNYPKGFRLEINDGARAEDVKAGQGVEFSHDYFSVGAIMASCKVLVGEPE